MKLKPLASASDVRNQLTAMTEIEILRFHYCYEIGSTFTSLSLMESEITNAMLICDKVEVNLKLGADSEEWRKLLEKQKLLQDSTLGSLIKILSKHSFNPQNLAYLHWIKGKRDFFIHRFFHIGCWPGDMNEEQLSSLVRTLRYLQILFVRASRRIWMIFIATGFLRTAD
jgi:hypothetical protein